MSRIPPIALRIASNSRNYDCSGISSYYYSHQLVSNWVLIQNVKTLGQQLVFHGNDFKPNNREYLIKPDLLPIITIMDAKRSWQAELQKHKPFFNSKVIGFACAFVFDALNTDVCIDQKCNTILKGAHNARTNHGALLGFIEKAPNGKQSKPINNQFSNVVPLQCDRLSLHTLEHILGYKQYQPTNSMFAFYLACTGLVSQCQGLPLSMLVQKPKGHNSAHYNKNKFLNKTFYFESLAPYAPKFNASISDICQNVTSPKGIPKCFISRSSDTMTQIHLWHLLPSNIVSTNAVINKSLRKKRVKPMSTYDRVTIGQYDYHANANDHARPPRSVLFHMYDLEHQWSYGLRSPICVRF